MSAEEDKKYTEPTKLDEGKKVFLGVGFFDFSSLIRVESCKLNLGRESNA